MSKSTPLNRWLRGKKQTARKIARGDISPTTVLRNKLVRAKRLVGLNPLEDVPLDRLLIGRQCGVPLENWIRKTGEYSRASTLLADSPYVTFLRAVDRDLTLLQDPDRLDRTAYFQMAEICRRHNGDFMGRKDKEGLRQWLREFYSFYDSVRAGLNDRSEEFDNTGHSGDNEPVQVLRLKESNCFEIIDGHHRCAIAFRLGRKKIRAEISGSDYSCLQKLVLAAMAPGERELAQPLDAPELHGWPVRPGCPEKGALLLDFLARHSRDAAGQSFLHIPCGYGFFLDLFRKKDFHVLGVDPEPAHRRIGRIVHNLPAEALSGDTPDKFLQNTTRTFDIVYVQIPLAGATLPLQELLSRLIRITTGVLFLDLREPAGESGQDSSWTNLLTDIVKPGVTVPLGRGLSAIVQD